MNEFKYNIGYALSGGFIKGFAHLGIMQALHEHGIRPEILSGVSAGALCGRHRRQRQEHLSSMPTAKSLIILLNFLSTIHSKN